MEDFTEHEDQWLRDALHGVSAPAGLRERIRSRLRQEVAVQLRHTTLDNASPTLVETVPVETAEGVAERVELPRRLEPASVPPRRQGLPRRQWLGWALALSAAALVFVALQWSRPYSPEQLAQLSLDQLELVLKEDTLWNRDFSEHFSELAVLDDQLRGHVEPLGFQNQSGGPFARRCRLWKLYSNTTHKSFYVFDFQDAREVRKLTAQLQAINRISGGWSMVAMRSANRVVVVLFEGAADDYLHRLQSA